MCSCRPLVVKVVTAQQTARRGAEAQTSRRRCRRMVNQVRLPPEELPEQRLLLGEGAEGQQDVEDLMTLSNDVTATRKETRRDRAREEESREQKEHHLVDREHTASRDRKTALTSEVGKFPFPWQMVVNVC